MKYAKRWLVVAIYAAAMAWVESAVVFYLRTLLDRIEPYQANPLPVVGGLGAVEMAREAATLIMLLMVGILAGKTWRSRLGYSAIAFGIWDILYYAFLKLMCDWPRSLFDWDILFLLPLPWWGPVLAPVSIAVLMILWGTLASQFELPNTGPSPWKTWALNFLGIGLALYLFMADALRVSGSGVEALRNFLPSRFNWSLFCVALILMAAPVIANLYRMLSTQNVINLARLTPGAGTSCPREGTALKLMARGRDVPAPGEARRTFDAVHDRTESPITIPVSEGN